MNKCKYTEYNTTQNVIFDVRQDTMEVMESLLKNDKTKALIKLKEMLDKTQR